jgi:2'-5' RNA ligase
VSSGRAEERARVFVGLPLTGGLGPRVAEAVAALLPPSAWRRSRPAGLHATLLFLGSVERVRLAPVLERVAAELAALPGPRLLLGAAGAFPGFARARVLWFGAEERAEAGRLEAVRGVLLRGFGAAGFDLGDEPWRPFHPHVTVARPHQAAARVPEAFRALAFSFPWDPPAAVCFESQPAPGGSRYEPLATMPFALE